MRLKKKRGPSLRMKKKSNKISKKYIKIQIFKKLISMNAKSLQLNISA